MLLMLYINIKAFEQSYEQNFKKKLIQHISTGCKRKKQYKY